MAKIPTIMNGHGRFLVPVVGCNVPLGWLAGTDWVGAADVLGFSVCSGKNQTLRFAFGNYVLRAQGPSRPTRPGSEFVSTNRWAQNAAF